MPRAAAPNSCRTCLARKIKCDGTLPICLRCSKQNLFCDRSAQLDIKQYCPPATDAQISPSVSLQQPEVGHLFHIYIKELAPWYDLNDATGTSFSTLVPAAALNEPLLFAAIIAFAGEYASRKYKMPATTAAVYHEHCLRLLISLSPEDRTIKDGVALAATCLLRSYEILAEREDPNRHLFGASTLIPLTPRLNDHGLLACGFWNYLREDITYSLIHECPLKIEVAAPFDQPTDDDHQANYITLLLAALVNIYFGSVQNDTRKLLLPFKHWRDRFAANPFSRIEAGTFPSIRMLKDCHVAAMHYYHVGMCMLEPDSRVSSAAEIIGLAMCAESEPVIVNAYGPICFSSGWIENGKQRQVLEGWLRSTQKKTGWSVDGLIAKLQQRWGYMT